MPTRNLKHAAGLFTMQAIAAGITLFFLASSALADAPNRAGDVKQAVQPIPLPAQQQEVLPEEIEALGPRNFGPVEPPVEVVPIYVPPEQPADESSEQLAWVHAHQYYGGYYRPYAYGYPYASYYRPYYYAYPYRYTYSGYYAPAYFSRYSYSPYVGYYSPYPYVGYRPVFVAPPVVYGGCYYW